MFWVRNIIETFSMKLQKHKFSLLHRKYWFLGHFCFWIIKNKIIIKLIERPTTMSLDGGRIVFDHPLSSTKMF